LNKCKKGKKKMNTYMPKSLEKLPVKAQMMFEQAFDRVKDDYGVNTGLKVAWNVVNKNFVVKEGMWVAKGMGRSLTTFTLQTKDNVFIKKGSDGEYFLEGVLSDINVDRDGKKFDEETLQSFADQINSDGISGFISHSDFDKFCVENSHLSEAEFISKARKTRKGIIKVVKAIYEKGKLWIKAIFDKRYIKQIKKFTKMSIEALIPNRFQKGNSYKGGYVIGLALDNDASNVRANITRLSPA